MGIVPTSLFLTICQKAPSTRRCIKTSLSDCGPKAAMAVRKHPAPEGALRRLEAVPWLEADCESESTQHQKVH